MQNAKLIDGLRWCADESICCDDFSGEKCPYFDEKKGSCSVDEILHAAADALEASSEQPTVDAVPVVHAYWIIKPHGTYGQLRAFCSACGKHSGIGGIVSNQKKPYCPNCGAIMDGKEIVDG